MDFLDTLKKVAPLLLMIVLLIPVLIFAEPIQAFLDGLDAEPTESIIETEESDVSAEAEPDEDHDKPIEDILTVENCEDLAKLLTLKDPFDPSVTEFAEKYKGCVIEFDSCIAYLSNHGDYKTRYDILLYGCDYSETSVSGPSFQFEDVGVYDLGIDDLYLPDYICAGRNVHVVAKVDGFDPNTGLFKLDPVSITDR